MATTYYSSQITLGNPTRYDVAGNFEIYSSFALTAALVINDVIQMCKVPNGARILNIEVYCDDLDTNVAPQLLLEIGDGNVTNRFVEACTLGQDASFIRGIQTKGGFCYQYTVDDTIDIKVNTAPATGAATGDIKMRVTCCVDN